MADPTIVIDRVANTHGDVAFMPHDHQIFTFHTILVSNKLNHSNNTIWKYQISKILRSLELEEYVLQDLPVVSSLK